MSPARPSRRRFLRHGLAAATAVLAGAGRVSQAGSVLRVGLTPVILDDQYAFLQRWQHWLEQKLGQPVRFVQRLKYRDITEALLIEELDAAWVCGYPYVRYRPYMTLLAVPRYKGGLTYHSYLIVSRALPQVQKLRQLKGRVFAFSDPDSNSGYLYPSYRFHELGLDPARFFERTFFTWAHRNTIDAVADDLADAGAVDSYIWEQYRRYHPEVVERTRIIERSPAFGFPPLVVRNSLPDGRRRRLQEILLHMHEDREGRELLEALGLDGFAPGTPRLYAGIERMWHAMGGGANRA